MENGLKFPQKVKQELAYDSANPFLAIYGKDWGRIETGIRTKTRAPMC